MHSHSRKLSDVDKSRPLGAFSLGLETSHGALRREEFEANLVLPMGTYHQEMCTAKTFPSSPALECRICFSPPESPQSS